LNSFAIAKPTTTLAANDFCGAGDHRRRLLDQVSGFRLKDDLAITVSAHERCF
jgi:hypothetical protein